MAALRPALITELGTPADLDDSTTYTLRMNNACGRDRNPGARSAPLSCSSVLWNLFPPLGTG